MVAECSFVELGPNNPTVEHHCCKDGEENWCCGPSRRGARVDKSLWPHTNPIWIYSSLARLGDETSRRGLDNQRIIIRPIKIDKFFITQTFRMSNFIISRCSLHLLMMNLSFCIDLILSLGSETHWSVKNSNIFNHESAE